MVFLAKQKQASYASWIAAALQAVMLPLLLPGTARPSFSLAPEISEADRLAVDNIVKISDFLTGAHSWKPQVHHYVLQMSKDMSAISCI